jgi:N-sulfoglucosamine sulfohydrolase
MVSAVDLLPTFLHIAEIKSPTGPGGIQGRSFLPVIRPIIRGSLKPPLSGVIFKEYNENSGGIRNPMRGVQTTQYLYLFNPWSNGKRTMATATNGTATWKRMLELASKNEAIRKRVDVMRYRTVEELYDINNDPDCLHNLAKSKEHQKTIKDLRQALHDWMKVTSDHAITAFTAHNDPEKMESYIKTVQTESDLRRKNKRKKKSKIKS